MKTMKNKTIYRHGDVPIYPLKGAVKGKLVKNNGSFVLAEGSTTGHKHLLTSPGMEIRQDEKGIYLVLKTEGKLTHEEHATLNLPEGKYFVGREREVDHFSKTVRAVID